MRIVLIILVLAFIFFMGLLFPTYIYLSDERKKKVESLVPYVLVSAFYISMTAIFVVLFESKAIVKDTVCSNIFSFNCIFTNILPKRIEPSFIVYLVMIVQLFGMFLYGYYTSKTVMHYSSKGRMYIELIIFFLVGVVSSLIHYMILFDVNFVGGTEYISLFSANQYCVLPMIYLLYMTYLNRDQIKLK